MGDGTRTIARVALICTAGLALASCTFLDMSFGLRQPPAPVDRTVETRSIFSMPRVRIPGFAGNAPTMPAAELQCRAQLKRMGVQFTDIAPIRDSAACYIDHPVKVSTLARGVALTPAATLNCQAALAAAQWLQETGGRAARTRYLSGIAEVRQISSYSCRRIRGSGTWSEHSKGNALDIGAFKLKNGRVIDVAKPGLFAFRERGFLRSVRAAACDDFTTVLGPGSDRDHADHFHFDLKQRSSGYRHCD
ncbi:MULTISPECIES: extensin family protein [unclassified Roseitalea]|uniref:extensin-like domain-containing protein n=1 Tax=unclassified Roseitalea TaxID=2639107 RepID=UPI00273E7FE5|nr:MULTISPECIES: extensin family protein [unclassified Roseitalea]